MLFENVFFYCFANITFFCDICAILTSKYTYRTERISFSSYSMLAVGIVGGRVAIYYV